MDMQLYVYMHGYAIIHKWKLTIHTVATYMYSYLAIYVVIYRSYGYSIISKATVTN